MTGRRQPRGVGEQPVRSAGEIMAANSIEELMPDPDRRDVALADLSTVVDHAADIWPLRASQKPSELNDGECDVLQDLSYGLGRQAIARNLAVPLETVKSRLKSAQLKLGARTTAHCIAEAWRRGLIR